VESIREDGFTVRVLPVDAHFPPRMMSGNAHSVLLVREVGQMKPEVIHYHNYLAWNFLYNAPLLKAGGTALIAQYHGRPDPLIFQRGRMFWPSFRLVDRYLVPTQAEELHLQNAFHVDRARITVFPNVGVDTSTFRPVMAKTEFPQFLYVGRIPLEPGSLWEKSPSRVLRILRALKDLNVSFKLDVAGDGPGMEHFMSIVDELGLRGEVNMLGFLDQRDLPPLYSSSWLTFVPMHMEGIDIGWDASLKESLACGTPVAAFNDDRPRSDELGLLLPSHPLGAAEMLAQFVENPGPLLKNAAKGPQLVAKSCDWSVVIGRLLGVYQKATVKTKATK